MIHRRGYFSCPRSRGAPVVVVQTAEHGNGLDAAFGLARPWNGLLLGESLVRARLVVEADVLGHQTAYRAPQRIDRADEVRDGLEPAQSAQPGGAQAPAGGSGK